MEKLFICIGIAFFIFLFLIMLCTDYFDGCEDTDFHIRDPWTGEIVDDYYDK